MANLHQQGQFNYYKCHLRLYDLEIGLFQIFQINCYCSDTRRKVSIFRSTFIVQNLTPLDPSYASISISFFRIPDYAFEIQLMPEIDSSGPGKEAGGCHPARYHLQGTLCLYPGLER